MNTLLLSPSFDAPEQQRGQQALLPVCEVPGHVGSEVSIEIFRRVVILQETVM